MALAETTRSRIRRKRSATEVVRDLDWWTVARLGVQVVLIVLLIVLA